MDDALIIMTMLSTCKAVSGWHLLVLPDVHSAKVSKIEIAGPMSMHCSLDLLTLAAVACNACGLWDKSFSSVAMLPETDIRRRVIAARFTAVQALLIQQLHILMAI